MRSKLLAKGLAGVAVTAAVVGLVGFVGAGTSSAADQSLTLTYSCPFPLIGTQDLSVKIDVGLPDTVVAGQPTPTIPITATVTVPAKAVQGLSLVGAATVQGSATANSTVTAPGVNLPITPKLNIPSTPVPASGSMTVVSTGSAPGVSFPQAGQGMISIGNFSTTLDPKKSDGTDTGLGTFTSDCTQDPNQNNMIMFTIQPGGGGTTTTAPPTTTTAPPTTTTAPPTTTTAPPTTTTAPPTTTTTVPPTTTTAPPTTTTPGGGNLNMTLGIKGTTHVKALGADVPVGPGTLKVSVDLSSGKFSGPLDLSKPNTANFKLLGFIPGSATVKLVSDGDTTGTYQAGQVNSDSKITIELPDITLFGGLPLVSNSTTCQAGSPADVQLSGPLDLQKGGTLTGTYTIPQLTGCGPLNGFISIFAAGDGNTISVDATPRSSGS